MRIYTDASYTENGDAGVGIVICKGEKKRTLGIPTPHMTSNNEAELFAIYMACILSGGEKCTITTDSQIALNYINKNVKEKPRTYEQHVRHKQCEFWAYKIRKFENATFEKVKGHSKDEKDKELNNNIADMLSKLGRIRSREI